MKTIGCQEKAKYVQKVTLSLVREKSDDFKERVTHPSEIAKLRLIKDELLNSDREKFIALHLTTKNQLISFEIVSVGSLNASIVHPRELFKGAILSNASSIILVHNHPSGIPEPSSEDIILTKRLREAGELLGIEVIDHLIFGTDRDSYVSFKENGYF